MSSRWFLGLKVAASISSVSTIWDPGKRRHWTDENHEETEHFWKIFNRIVGQAADHGFVAGDELVTDGMLIKANASKKKFEVMQVEDSAQEFFDELPQGLSPVSVGERHDAEGEIQLPCGERPLPLPRQQRPYIQNDQ